MKFLSLVFIIAGIIGILCGVIVTPEFATTYISSDKVITPEGYRAIYKLRWFSFLLGSLFLLIGILSFKFPTHTKNFVNSQIGIIAILIIGWISMAFINFLIKRMGLNTGTPDFFPFSEFYGPRIIPSGIPYTLLFLIVFFISLKLSEYFNVFHVWLVGLILIILANLAQGGIEAAFYKPLNAPFYYQGVAYYHQYYHEAIKIVDWYEWVSNFNENQIYLLKHTRTHPPFAVLLHYLIIKLSNNNILLLAGSFVLLSSLSIPLIFGVMRSIGLSIQQSSLLALLFSVIPSYNIYSVVSLDGIIVTFSIIFLWGITIIIKRGINGAGVLLFTSGIIFANLLTFLALFLVATAGLIALKEFIFNKKRDVLLAILWTLIVMLFLYFGLVYFLRYDHIQAFLTAAGLEPKSIINKPLVYLMTRLENLTMFTIFLSFGIVSLLLHSKSLKLQIFDLRDDINAIFFAGIIPLLLFLLIGGLYTGEIARICMFIYPFFLLLLRNVEKSVLRNTIIAAGIQTIIMQTFGGYFW